MASSNIYISVPYYDLPDDIEPDDQERMQPILDQVLHTAVDNPVSYDKPYANVIWKMHMSGLAGKAANAWLDVHYPPPNERTFTSFNGMTMEQKDFYLPALKVLSFSNGRFYSPAKGTYWKDFELKASHVEAESSYTISYKTTNNSLPSYDYGDVPRIIHDFKLDCSCGIYGGMNISEMRIYMHDSGMRVNFDNNLVRMDRKLCIIEPSNGAEVAIARKGWRASSAFISEIVDETMSASDASALLSMVWNREIDASEVYKPLSHNELV